MRRSLDARSRFSAIVLSLTALSATIACTGVIGDDSGQIGGPGGPNPDDPNDPNGRKLADALVDSTRFPRLTHAQWENTVRDLLKLSEKPGNSASFTTDPPGSTFGNDGALLKVTPGLWGDYQKAAEDVATKLTSDSARLAKVLPPGLPASGDERAIAFIKGFGMRAWRRPLDEANEVPKLLALFKRGTELTGMTDAFAAGVNVVVQEMLQSPYFVYRVELGVPKEDGTVGLNEWEMASRLSYALWNTMPDDKLFAAAADKSILTAEGLEAQARRLIDDPRAEPMLADFHERLFQFDHFDAIKKDTTLFPEWADAAGMSRAMRMEAELFVRDVTVAQNKGLTELLTADYSFVNEKLAPAYGLSGFGSEFKKTKLDPSQRAGILTQIGFLAANASPRETDPIHRGVFINLKVICANLPPPPMNVPPLPAATGKTMRDRVAAHTGKGTCGAGCHGTMINPAGFAFETFDASGRWRTKDNGLPVNAADTYPFEDAAISYNGPVEFAKVLSQRIQVHRCYAGNWLEYTYGRQKAKGDEALIEGVAKASLGGASTKDLILKFVMARAFSHRPAGGS